jgi:hypothetical protein
MRIENPNQDFPGLQRFGTLCPNSQRGIQTVSDLSILSKPKGMETWLTIRSEGHLFNAKYAGHATFYTIRNPEAIRRRSAAESLGR